MAACANCTPPACRLACSKTRQFQMVQTQLEPGDKLVIYSDGLTEAENADGEFFDTERLRVCLRDNAERDAASLHTALLARGRPFHRRRRDSRRHHRAGARIRVPGESSILPRTAAFREAVPLGGGAAVFEHLVAEWSRTQPFEFRSDSSDSGSVRAAAEIWSASASALMPDSLANSNGRRRKKFCGTIRRYDRAGKRCFRRPGFRALAARGYRIFTIYHVDVVAYVAEIYGRGLIRPETTVAGIAGCAGFCPRCRSWCGKSRRRACGTRAG